MNIKENPGFYAIIPANVRYADIIPHAKLLYGELTALASKSGSCYASNAYFSELYGVSTRQVSTWIGELEKHGFIESKIEQGEGNKRYISIIATYGRKLPDPIEENFHTYGRKLPDPIEENFLYNNTVIKTNNNTDIIIEEEQKQIDSEIIDNIEDMRRFLNK